MLGEGALKTCRYRDKRNETLQILRDLQEELSTTSGNIETIEKLGNPVVSTNYVCQLFNFKPHKEENRSILKISVAYIGASGCIFKVNVEILEGSECPDGSEYDIGVEYSLETPDIQLKEVSNDLRQLFKTTQIPKSLGVDTNEFWVNFHDYLQMMIKKARFPSEKFMKLLIL